MTLNATLLNKIGNALTFSLSSLILWIVIKYSDRFLPNVLFFLFWLLSIGILFIAFTKKITLSNQGIDVKWKIGFNNIILLQRKDYHINWHEIEQIFCFYPYWFPFHFFQINAKVNGRRRIQVVGNGITHKKEALLYIADRVPDSIFDDGTRKMIRKYRKRCSGN